jgi:fibronectin type 3 domain-containing protein
MNKPRPGKAPAALLLLLLLFAGCRDLFHPEGPGDDGDGKTRVYFVNGNDFSVVVYSDSSRLVKFADVKANAESNPAETDLDSNAVFYLSYRIMIEDQEFSYNSSLPARVDEEKTTRVTIPLLSELDSAELAKPVAAGVYIKIQNTGASALVLRKGASDEIPQGASSPILNGGETALYLINSGAASNYSFMKNSVTAVAFPSGLTNFQEGHLYSLKFDGTALALLADRPITIAQALKILPPENISAKSLADGHIALAWDKVGTETGYVVYRSDSETGAYARVGTTEGVSYTDTAVTIGAAYYYRISSVKNNVESDKSTVVVSARAEISSLATPAGLTVTAQTENSISLSWQAAPDATGYKVYKGLSSDTANEYVAETASTSRSITGLEANTSYYFAVSAVNENGESLPTAAVEGKTSAITLQAPAGLSVTGQTENSISLSWQAAPNATGYKVYKGVSSDTANEYVAETATTSYTVTGLAVNTSYYFAVSAANENGESPRSAAAQGTTSETALEAPAGLSVTGKTQTSLTLSWQAVSGAEGYRISRSAGSSASYAPIGTTAGVTYSDTNLTPETSYNYRVTAYKGQRESAAATTSGTTVSGGGTIPLPPAKPAGLVVSNVGSGSVSLSWNSVANANSYDIYRRNSQTGASAKIGTETGTAWTDSTVSSGVMYYYTVRAVNASGNSPDSNMTFACAASHYSLPTSGSSVLMNLSAGSKHYYRLPVTAGQNVTITWENGSSQNANVPCSAWQNDGTAIFTGSWNGYTSPRAFTAATAGYITVEMANTSSSTSYNYKIYYN